MSQILTARRSVFSLRRMDGGSSHDERRVEFFLQYFSSHDDVKAMTPVLVKRHDARTAADASYQAMLRARPQLPGVDIAQVQLAEALRIVGDQIELARAAPAAGR